MADLFRRYNHGVTTKPGKPSDMPIVDHLRDLRVRLAKALIALTVTTLASFVLAERIIRIIAVPVGGLEQLQSIEITENVGVFMRVSLLSGFILALPFILYQVVRFVLPGLEKKETRGLMLAIPAATLLFLAGVAFSYFIMLPKALPFLTEFLGVRTTPRLSNYMNFVTSLLFWSGVSFEAPLVVLILARMGLVTAGALARQWRVAVVVIAVIAAIVTPTIDAVTMGLMMLPLLALYALSIVLAWAVQPKG